MTHWGKHRGKSCRCLGLITQCKASAFEVFEICFGFDTRRFGLPTRAPVSVFWARGAKGTGGVVLLCMDEIHSHHFETMAETITFVGIHGRIIIPGLRWCEMDFVHPQYCLREAVRPQTVVLILWKLKSRISGADPTSPQTSNSRFQVLVFAMDPFFFFWGGGRAVSSRVRKDFSPTKCLVEIDFCQTSRNPRGISRVRDVNLRFVWVREDYFGALGIGPKPYVSFLFC